MTMNTLSFQLSAAAHTIQPSPTLAINEEVARRRAAGKPTIHLGFGEASFPLPPLLKEALTASAGQTRYAPVLGLPELRQAIADYLTRTRQVPYRAEQIFIGPGSKAILYLLLNILAGDVLLPAPSWVSYSPIIRFAGRRVFHVQTEADHHCLTPARLSQAREAAIQAGGNPTILLINSPNNPTGGMFAPSDIEAIATWARTEGILLISDEIYAELAHGWREHITPARFYPEGCLVTGGISKAFSAGGWRLGYVALPTAMAEGSMLTACHALASEIWSAVATPIQQAAIAAFQDDPSIATYLQQAASTHALIASRLHQTLIQLDVDCPRPAGGFYLYPDFSSWRHKLATMGITTSELLAQYLLDQWDISSLPASAFEETGETLRLRLATSQLCEPEASLTPWEREAALWSLLQDPANAPLPALTRAQERWQEVIHFLNNQ